MIIGIFNDNVNNNNSNTSNNSNIYTDNNSGNFKANAQSLFLCNHPESGTSSAYTIFPWMSKK